MGLSGNARDRGGNAPRGKTISDRITLAELLGFHPEAIEITDRLLSRFGGLPRVFAASLAAVRTCAGDDAARAINAARHVCLALLREDIGADVRITDSSQCIRYVRGRLANRRQEVLLVLHLDGEQRLIADEEAAIGTVDEVPVHPREIVGRAIELGSLSIIVAHNHPSGRPTPSNADISTSTKLAAAAATMGVILQDHLIVARRGWTSLRAEGLL